MSEQVGHLRAEFSIDLSPLERGLRRARRLMEQFDDDSASADLTLSTRSFDRSLSRARRALSDLSDEEGEVDVGANLSPLSRGLSRARGMLASLRGERANVAVGANTATANRNLANVQRFVRNLNGSRATVSVAANGAPQANAQLASVQRFAANLNGRRAAVNVSAAGAPGALMVMGTVSRAAGALNGRNAIVNIGTRGAAGAIASMAAVGAAARTLGTAVQMGTQQGINRFNKAALFMSNVAAYGMRLAIFGLVGAFGPLVGMAGVAASAVASVGAGFGLLGLAAIPTMRALTTEGAKLTASQKALKEEAKGFYAAFEQAFAPATTRVEQLATATMSYTRGALKPLGATAKATADAVGRAGANMRKQFDDPRQLALFNEFLSRVPNMTRLFTQAAGQFGLGIFNMLTAAQPVAQDFLRYLNRITLQFSKWSSSAQGQRQMREFFEAVVPVARALGRAIAAVTTGLFKLTTQPAVIGFFTKLLNAITFIGQRIQPALTPLFAGMNRLAGLFTRIPEPIRSAAATVGIFAAAVGLLAGGPLIILGSILMRVVGAFRLLSAPVRMLGPLFARIGPLFTRIGGALTRVVPFFTRLGGIFARIVPLVARFVPWIARIALIGALANPIGIVVTVLITLGTVFVMLYRRSEAFRNAVNALARGVATVAVAAFRALRAGAIAAVRGLINYVRQGWTNLKTVTLAIFTAIRVGALASWRLLRAGVVAIARGVAAGARAAWNLLRAGTVAVFRGTVAVVRAIWSGLRAFVVAIARGAANGARAAWQLLRTVTVAAFRGAVNVARAVWTGLRQIVVSVARAAANGARAAWQLLRTVTVTAFRGAVNVARAVWNGLTRTVVAGARAAANGARAAWNLLRNVTTTVFRAIANIGRSVWNGIRTVVTAAARGAMAGARAAWNALRNVTTSVFNGIRNFLRSFWAGIRKIFDSALSAIGSRIKSWTSATRSAFSALGSWARNHWNRFWSFIRNLWDSALRAIGNRVDSWRRAINNAMSALASWARNHWQRFWSFIRNLWDDALRAIGNRVDSWRRAINNAMSALARWARGHWSDFWSGLRRMWDNALSAIGDRARSWGDAIRSLFKRVAGWMTTPIENARDTLKGIWNTILGGIARVLEAVNIPGSKKIRGAMWASGGTTQDGGGQAFAQGGTTLRQAKPARFAAGGMGTSTRQPRMHLWNEQMGNEAYITERGKTRDQMRYLNTAAGWHGAKVVPQQAFPQDAPHRVPSEPPPAGAHSHIHDAISRSQARRKSAGTRGAHPDFSRNHKNVYDYIKERADKVAGAMGVSWNTYHHHITAPGANEHSSVDFWGGGPGVAIGSSKGSATANYVVKNFPEGNLGTIWNRRVSTGGGWRPFSGGPHLDHVHVGWSTDPNAPIVSGGGVGGFSIPNPMQILFDKMWNNTVGRTMDGFRNRMEGGHVLRQGTAGAATMVTQAIHKWIDDKIPDTIGGSGSSGGPGTNFDAANNIALGKKMNEAMGWGGQWNSLKQLWQKESNWNNKARNPSSGAYGIPQALPPSKMGPDANPPKSDPAAQIDWGLGYIKGRYGSPNAAWGHSQRVGWYQRGGVVPGFRPMPAVVHGGERVLPRDLNTSFESLSRSIDSWNSRGASAPSVDVGGSEISRLEKKFDALMERLDDGLDVYERNWSEGEKTMLNSQRSKAGREIQRQNADDETKRKLARRS